VYEKVCLDELSKLPLNFIANFLIHLVMYRCGEVQINFDWKDEQKQKEF
jgi:hypothetical protein